MKKIIVLLFICIYAHVNAQSVKVNWSELQTYDNKGDGFFDYFIGANSKYVYAKFNKMAWKPAKANSKIKIVAFDKVTMKQVATKAIRGYKENGGKSDKYEGLEFFKSIVFENSVLLFWKKQVKDRYELYAESFDEKLGKNQKLKKIYEVAKKGKKYDPNFFVIGNKLVGNKIIIGAELPADKGENIILEYKVLKTDFTFDAANQVKLPYIAKSNREGLTSSYKIEDDGNLYAKTSIKMDKDERKELKKHESPEYVMLSVIKPTTGSIKSYNFKFDDKNLSDLHFVANTNGVKIYGLYSDLTKDKYGVDIHGIYFAEIDNDLNTLENAKFINFDKSTLDKLFEKDRDAKNKSGVFASKKSKKSDDESLQGSYTIENVQIADNNSIILFCSLMKNYSTTTCDSKGNCTTRYYCYKGNVTSFKVSNTGTLIWASNLDRAITYNGSNVYDVEVVKDNKKYYAVYGNEFNIVGVKDNGKVKKKGKNKAQRRDMFEYSVFNDDNGTFTRNEYKINAVNAAKKEKKWISPFGIVVLDNKMYVNSTRISQKVGPTVLFCTLGLICPPVAYIPFVSGNAKKGWGYLGTIIPAK